MKIREKDNNFQGLVHKHCLAGALIKCSNIPCPCTFKCFVIQYRNLILCFPTESKILPHQEDTYSAFYSVRQHAFVKNEFHYLNVSRVGSFAVYDAFDCTFECLSNHSCLSVNMAALTKELTENFGASCCLLINTKTPQSTKETRVHITFPLRYKY